MPIDSDGISGRRVTKEEFDLLGYLDARVFIDSAVKRFTGWHSSFDPDHPDWSARVQVQRALGQGVARALAPRAGVLESRGKLRIVFLGASLGSIATYFTIGALRAAGVRVPLELSIFDYLQEPLERTRAGRFEMPARAVEEAGFSAVLTEAEYKKILSQALVFSGLVTQIPAEDGLYDVVVAPYIHHHLNFYDKKIACAEMRRITRPGGFLALGDLTFSWPQFNAWLEKHASEEYPYSAESFVSCESHVGMFGPDVSLLDRHQGDFYYTFVLEDLRPAKGSEES